MDIDEREPGTPSIEIAKDTKVLELKDTGDRANESSQETGFLDLSYTIKSMILKTLPIADLVYMQRTNTEVNDLINEEGLIDKGYIALCHQANLLPSSGKSGDLVMQTIFSKRRRKVIMRENIRYTITRGLVGSLNLNCAAEELTRIDAAEKIYERHGRPICYKETGQEQIKEMGKVLDVIENDASEIENYIMKWRFELAYQLRCILRLGRTKINDFVFMVHCLKCPECLENQDSNSDTIDSLTEYMRSQITKRTPELMSMLYCQKSRTRQGYKYCKEQITLATNTNFNVKIKLLMENTILWKAEINRRIAIWIAKVHAGMASIHHSDRVYSRIDAYRPCMPREDEAQYED